MNRRMITKEERNRMMKEIEKVANEKLVSLSFFSKKFGKHISTIQSMFYELERTGKLVSLPTVIMVGGNIPMRFWLGKRLLKKICKEVGKR